MKSRIYLSFIALMFIGSTVFAQTNRKENKKYDLSKMSFKFEGKTWMYAPQKNKDGKVDKFFLENQQFVIEYKKDKAYEVMALTDADKSKIVKHYPKLKNKDIRFKLKYYLLSCGFMNVYAYLVKHETNKLTFDGRDGKMVFVAKK